jgi:hypothetical protein
MPYNLRMDDNQIIDAMGGTAEVARICDLKMPSVSDWRTCGIPKPWRNALAAIRPDLFPEESKRIRDIKRRQSARRKGA